MSLIGSSPSFTKAFTSFGTVWASWAVLEDKATVMRRQATSLTARRFLFLHRPHRWIRTWGR